MGCWRWRAEVPKQEGVPGTGGSPCTPFVQTDMDFAALARVDPAASPLALIGGILCRLPAVAS